jgi:Holliday junction resolvase RusA-like endonuclease
MPWTIDQVNEHNRRNPNPVHRELGRPAAVKAPDYLAKAVAVFESVVLPLNMSLCKSVVITGQIRGGKNSVQSTRDGRRYPKANWAKWRDAAVREVRAQLPRDWKPLDTLTNVRLDYVAGDRRRRDFPAICDAAWHVLERAGFVTDDTHLWPAESSRAYNKSAPRLTITIL